MFIGKLFNQVFISYPKVTHSVDKPFSYILATLFSFWFMNKSVVWGLLLSEYLLLSTLFPQGIWSNSRFTVKQWLDVFHSRQFFSFKNTHGSDNMIKLNMILIQFFWKKIPWIGKKDWINLAVSLLLKTYLSSISWSLQNPMYK